MEAVKRSPRRGVVGGKRMQAPRKRKLELWWCWTEDHHEDWFVVAGHGFDAVRLFEEYEGYDEGDAQAESVLTLPEEYQDKRYVGWPSDELLVACGASILRSETPRVVEIRRVRYTEGMLEHQILKATDDLSERKGRGRPNRTQRDRVS
jgi:hypothetical protein